MTKPLPPDREKKRPDPSGNATLMIQVSALDKQAIDKLSEHLGVSSIVVVRHALQLFIKSLKDAGWDGKYHNKSGSEAEARNGHR